MTGHQLARLPARISTGMMGIKGMRAALHGAIRRQTARRQLLSLNDRLLRDIGLSRADLEMDRLLRI